MILAELVTLIYTWGVDIIPSSRPAHAVLGSVSHTLAVSAPVAPAASCDPTWTSSSRQCLISDEEIQILSASFR